MFKIIIKVQLNFSFKNLYLFAVEENAILKCPSKMLTRFMQLLQLEDQR